MYTLSWFLKYFGLPFSVTVTMYALFCGANKRRRAVLKDKIVVITGASSGIGEALAHAFYEQGSKVVLASRRESELLRVKDDLMSKKLSTPTQDPIVLSLDLADFNNMSIFVEKVYELCGHIDILINNGGISHRASVMDTKVDVYERIMYTNYFGSVALTKAALPQMIERKCGHIVFVSSVQGLVAIPHRSAYASSKHALQAFADSLRAEMNEHNVNVLVVSPGYVKTAISVNALTGSGVNHGIMDKSTAAGYSPEYCAQKVLDAVVNHNKELIVSQISGRFGVFIRHACPSLYFWIVAKRARNTQW